MPFADAVRPIIEGRTFGFCKLIADRGTGRIPGCHVVGEQTVEIAQLAAVAIAANMCVDELARIAVSFPMYAEDPGRDRARSHLRPDAGAPGGDEALREPVGFAGVREQAGLDLQRYTGVTVHSDRIATFR